MECSRRAERVHLPAGDRRYRSRAVVEAEAVPVVRGIGEGPESLAARGVEAANALLISLTIEEDEAVPGHRGAAVTRTDLDLPDQGRSRRGPLPASESGDPPESTDAPASRSTAGLSPEPASAEAETVQPAAFSGSWRRVSSKSGAAAPGDAAFRTGSARVSSALPGRQTDWHSSQLTRAFSTTSDEDRSAGTWSSTGSSTSSW